MRVKFPSYNNPKHNSRLFLKKCQCSIPVDVAHHIFHGSVPAGCDFRCPQPGQGRHNSCAELLTLALTWSFPPKSRTDRVRRDLAEMEKEIVVLRRVKLECLFAGTVEWAAGSCLAPFVVKDVEKYFCPSRRQPIMVVEILI